jgi:hypothetical protein
MYVCICIYIIQVSSCTLTEICVYTGEGGREKGEREGLTGCFQLALACKRGIRKESYSLDYCVGMLVCMCNAYIYTITVKQGAKGWAEASAPCRAVAKGWAEEVRGIV